MEDFFSPAQFLEGTNNSASNDDLRALGKDVAVAERKVQTVAYAFGPDGPVENGKIRKALLLFGGAGSGKSTLLREFPEMRERYNDPATFADDSAGGNARLYMERYIPRMIELGIEVEADYVGCPIMDAYNRNAMRSAAHSESEFIGKHKRAQYRYMDVYEKFGNPNDSHAGLFLFQGISVDGG